MNHRRNLRLLVVAQALYSSAPPLNAFAAGLVGARLAPSPELATLPVALLLVGLASFTVPAAHWSRRRGRRSAFLGGAILAMIAAASAALAIFWETFWGFCAATFALGFNQAFVQQYRFAAAESAPQGQAPRAISTVLLGTLVAAWLGPELAKRSPSIGPLNELASAYLLLAGLAVLGSVSLTFLRGLDALPELPPRTTAGRASLFQRPGFVLAVVTSGLAYAVMVFVMTATPLSMHRVDGHTMHHTASVIQAHILAMFAPSFVSGRLVARLGETRVMWFGLAAVGICLVIAALGRDLLHYATSLILLGIGWNFLFVGATALLVRQYDQAEKSSAEAINDFVVFSLAAGSSLFSGSALHRFGWEGVLGLGLIPTGLLFVALLWYGQTSRSPGQSSSPI